MVCVTDLNVNLSLSWFLLYTVLVTQLLLRFSTDVYDCLFRCLPMNIAPEDIATGFLKDRVKIGSSLADVDPMGLDRNVSKLLKSVNTVICQDLSMFWS